MAYVYRHIRLDKNEVFYIGIGSDNKGKYTRAFNKYKSVRSDIWSKIVSKTSYEVEIVLDDLSWEEAKLKEREFIQLYGRKNLNKGSLANLTDGGDGVLGYIMTQETKNKIPHLWKKGRIIPEDQLIKLIKTRTSWYKHSDTTKQKISQSHKGKVLSKQSRQQISDTLRAKNLVSPHRKLVLNLETGIYYDSVTLAAYSLNIPRKYLSRKLSGQRRNDTTMTLV